MEPPKLPGKNDSGAVDSDSRIKLDEKFWKNFRHRFGEIEAEISHLSSNDDSLRAHLDTLKRSCQALQQEVTDATLYLPKYSLKRAQEVSALVQNIHYNIIPIFLVMYNVFVQQLSQLRTLLSTREDELAPKKKFSFSSRKKEANVDGVVAPTPAVKSSFKPLSSVDEKSTVGFCNVTNETLKLTDDAIRHCDVELSDLDDCIVHIQGSPPSVHISRLSNTKVLLGPCQFSVFIDDCRDCHFSIACQQLRIHKSIHCVFSIHVTSAAIIEDCSGVAFAPYNYKYEHIQDHFQVLAVGMGNCVLHRWCFASF
jgi:hypothetical protein